MRIVFTFNDILGLGIMGVFIIIAVICFIIAVIDVYTKDWRYEHFKCPKCSNRHPDGCCGHFRNAKCDCDYYCKTRSKK